mmetsp:Transcript_8906/g.18505  ORF Transcript_8906/g.18505 Transcript_8906/m.18505 type:complete len:338 (-) Transcript_8906:1594-2607(-)
MSYNETFQIHDFVGKDIIDRYDGFILDQFGVLHNGVCGLEGAPELVKLLVHHYDKKCVILSNTSSSSQKSKQKLPRLGYDPSDFCNAVTSGQEAGRHIRDTYACDKTKKALWFTWKGNSPIKFLELCGDIPLTTDPKEADYVILHGVDVLRGPGEDGEASEISLGDFHTSGSMDDNSDSETITIDSVLQECASRNLPMVCANPDFIMVKPDGSTGYMPGTIVKRYEELGGKCTSFGKPHVPHFEACLRDLDLDKTRVVHVGDSLHHDILGANATGIDSIFVTGGIHRTELGTKLNNVASKKSLEQLFTKHGQTPTHVVPMFRTKSKDDVFEDEKKED